MTGKRSEGVGTEIRRRAAAGLKIGDRFSVTRTFSEAEIVEFARLTGDDNPVHSDGAFARLKGFPRTICHGLLTGALITEIGGQIGWLATRMSFEFLRPVFPGDTVVCAMTIASIDARGFAIAEGTLTTGAGGEVMRVRLEGFLPKDAERRRLAEILDEGKPITRR